MNEWNKRTSSAAVAERVCLVCEQRLPSKQGRVDLLADILERVPRFTELTRCRTNAHPEQPREYFVDSESDLKTTDSKSAMPDLKNCALAQEAIESKSGSAFWCHTCRNALSIGRQPPCAIVNDLWVGDVPECLRVLTYPERVLISPYRILIYTLHMRRVMGYSQWGYKGTMYAYPQRTADIYPMLPLPLDALRQSFSVQFVGRKPERKYLGKIFSVNRARVAEA
jgi:hypothetical protein